MIHFIKVFFFKEMCMKIGLVILSLAVVLVAGSVFVFDRSNASVIGPISGITAPVIRFELDPARSKFMVKARRGGLAWFKGHSHHLAVRDFDGRVELSLDTLNPASLQMTIRADSLEETGANFTPQQRKIIEKELDEIVLETAKYPEITFRSTEVKGELKNGNFEVKIAGDITLHGVTRQITIPATVTADGDSLRAQGEFE